MQIQSDERRFFNSSGITAAFSSEGVRKRAKPKTMANYDLLSSTIENEFLKNAIRWSSQVLFQAILKGRLTLKRIA